MLIKHLKFYLCLTTMLLWHTTAMSQDRLSFGFKAGLNTSTLAGSGTNESYSNNTGFHLGALVKYAITDKFGVKGELMYSQKGGKYRYEGPSFYYLDDRIAKPVLARGDRIMNLDVSNDYIDFPMLIYGKFGHFEINGGINVGLLVGSSGTGQVKFTGSDPAFSEFTLNLDHRYYKDDAGESDAMFRELVNVDGTEYSLPKTVGAYYEYMEKSKGLYNFIDIGLNAGISIYLNEGLYFGARANYGLLDVSRSETQVTYEEFDGNAPALQNTSEKQVSFQFSIGFSF